MGREKKTGPGPGPPPGAHAKERHKKSAKDVDYSIPVQPGLKAKPDVPGLKLKHHSYFEIVENKDKKKKLEYQVTNDRNPPPGFDFVPIGNPELTNACKEISRDQDALIFIVTTYHSLESEDLSQHMNRIGHHIRQTIVEQARGIIGDSDDSSNGHIPGQPEPIPETQEQINEQADAALRDLFPRIPHTDRQMIIDHAFRKGAKMKGEPLVGLAKDITLSRRVQLAVLAHIRHTHTRYDRLLKETSYENARRAVQSLCLEIIVKWRGDEETGRDQLDEILREVIVISDSEGSDGDLTDSDDDDDSDSASVQEVAGPGDVGVPQTASLSRAAYKTNQLKSKKRARPKKQGQRKLARTPGRHGAKSRNERTAARKAQRGFSRYQAALDEARDRVRHEVVPESAPSQPTPMFRSISHGSQPLDPSQPRAAYYDIHRPATHVDATRMASVEMYNTTGPRPIVDNMDQRVPANNYSHHGSNPQEWRRIRTPGPSHQRIHSADSWTEHGRPSGPNDRGPAQKLVVRSEKLQDYLVPSIEPRSPGVNQSSPPVFVRSVPPAAHFARPHGNPPQPTLSYERPYEREYSPSRAVSPGGDINKRRRVASEHFERALVPSVVDHNPPLLVSRRHRDSPVSYPVEQIRVIPLRQPAQEIQFQRLPVAAPRKHFIDDQGSILREEPGRPIVVEDWAAPRERVVVMPSTQRGYRERSPLPQKHEIIQIRRPVYTHRPDSDAHRVVAMESVGSRVRDRYERLPVEYIPVSNRSRHPDDPRPVQVIRPETFVHHREIFDDHYRHMQPAPALREPPTYQASEPAYTPTYLQDHGTRPQAVIPISNGYGGYEQQQEPPHESHPMRQDGLPPAQAGRPRYPPDLPPLHR